MFDLQFSGILPDFSLPPAEMSAKYGSIANAYKRAGQYYAMAFNRVGVKFSTDETISNSATEFQEITRNFDMFHGLHKTGMFGFMDMVFDNNNNQSEAALPIRPGQDSATIFLFLQGLFLQVANNAEANAMVMNQELKNQLTEKFKMVELSRKYGDFLKEIESITDSKFQPPADPAAGQDAIMKAVFSSVGSGLQKDANMLWKYIKENTAGFGDMLRAYTNQLCGRRAVIETLDSGMLRIHNPKYYTSTSTDDDDFGRFDTSRSLIFQMDSQECAEYYKKDLDPYMYQAIKDGQLFNNTPFTSMIVPQYNYNLWSPQTNKVTIVRTYFQSYADSRYYKKYNSELNVNEVQALRLGSTKKGELVKVVRRVDMIANVAAVNYGIDAIVEDPNQFGNQMYRLMVFQPNMYDGKNVCLADRVMTKQEQIDAVESRINEFFSQDLGNIIEFIGSQFDNGIDPQKIWGKLKRTKIHIRKHSPHLEDPTNRMNSVNLINASLMGDIERYIGLKSSFKNDIKEIANVNNITMGTPGEYVGAQTQKNSVALANNSVQYGIIGTMQLFADAGSYGIEMLRRRVIEDPTNPVYLNLLGEDGVQRIIDSKDIPYNKWLLRLKFNDIIDPNTKGRMLAFLEQLAAQGQADFRDFLNVESAKTISELKDSADYAIEKRNYREMLKEAANMQARNEGIQEMANANMESAAMKEQGKVAAADRNGMFKLADTAMKETGDPQAAAAIMQGAQQQQMPPQQQQQEMQPAQ